MRIRLTIDIERGHNRQRPGHSEDTVLDVTAMANEDLRENETDTRPRRMGFESERMGKRRGH